MICKKCLIEKPESEFSKCKKGKMYKCKKCDNERRKKQYWDNPELSRARKRKDWKEKVMLDEIEFHKSQLTDRYIKKQLKKKKIPINDYTMKWKREMIATRRAIMFKVGEKTYLMKNNRNGYHKIGRSVNPKYRESTLMAEEPEITLIWSTNKNMERELQRMFEEKRVRGEWYNLTQDDVDYIKSLN